MKKITNKTFDEERALYNIKNCEVVDCKFDGPKDGESPLKESEDIKVNNCFFNLRYPLWHDNGVKMDACELTELSRAALWYSNNIDIKNSKLHGIKALRQCKDIKISKCDIISPEFGWYCKNINMKSSKVVSEYFMLRTKNLKLKNVEMSGKYSFQYSKSIDIENSNFDTKDAFWHCKNVTVKNSILKGEYLAWYTDGLTLINCTIIGTQPLCYCKNLKLVNCKMVDTDLAFEYSDVDATILGSIDSVKNPKSGKIVADDIKEIILADSKIKSKCTIESKNAH